MEYKTVLQSDFFFGNFFLEAIPHPSGVLGGIFSSISIFCHYAGGITFFVFLLPFIYLCYSRQLGIKLAVSLLSAGMINGLTKFYFESPRPSNLSPVFFDLIQIAEEKSFGFPSGHAHVAVLIWGIFFLHFKNRILKSFSFLMIIFVPISRMYMGVHYPGDVLGGFLMGLSSLLLIEWFFQKSPDFPNLGNLKNKKAPQLTRSISLALVAITLPATLITKSGASEIHHASLNSVVSASGSLAGFFSGVLFLKYRFGSHYFSWTQTKSIQSFAVRSVFILLGIFVFYFLLGSLSKKFFNDDPLFRYFRYFILNFYLVSITPFLLYKIADGKFIKS